MLDCVEECYVRDQHVGRRQTTRTVEVNTLAVSASVLALVASVDIVSECLLQSIAHRMKVAFKQIAEITGYSQHKFGGQYSRHAGRREANTADHLRNIDPCHFNGPSHGPIHAQGHTASDKARRSSGATNG